MYRSVVNGVFVDLGLSNHLVCLFGTVLGVQISEIGAFVVVVNHIGKVNGVAH